MALAAVVALGALLWAAALDARTLGEAAYRRTLILGGLPTRPLVIVALVVLPAVLALRFDLRWRSPALRRFTVLVCVPLAWAFSAYAANPYFQQGHLVDRALVLALVVLVWRHPAFLGPFIALTSAIGGQFSHPIGGYTWVDKELLLAVLCMVLAGSLLAVAVPEAVPLLPLIVVGTVAAPYLGAGLGKARFRWLDEDLGNLFAASHVNGWLAGWDESTITSVAERLEALSPAVAALTILVEVAVVLVAVRRRAVVPVVVAVAALHLAIYAASGIFFWKWLVLLAALALLLRSPSEAGIWHRSTWARLGIVGVALVASLAVHRPTTLAWRDTALTQSFEVEVVFADGSVHPVPRLDLEPYDTLFAQNRFFRLTREPRVVGTYGAVSSADLADEIDATDADGIPALKEGRGEVLFSARFTAGFDRLLTALIAGDDPSGLPLLPSAPHHIQSQGGDPGWSAEEPVEVRIRLREVLRTDDDLVLLSDEVVHRIEL